MGLFEPKWIVFCLLPGILAAPGYPACNYSTVWLDMVFVIDGSAEMGKSHLETAWNSATETLDRFTVEYANFTKSNYTSRLGIVIYGDNSTVYRPLGSIDNEDIGNIKTLPYNGDENSNLEEGIRAAIGEFNGVGHRPNARRVIVIMAATFREKGSVSPEQLAETFKESGGVIIVYHVSKLGAQTQMLKEIASTGYFLNSGSETVLADALCDGCYTVIRSPSGFSRAVRYCSQFYSGIVASDETANKTTFLTGLIQNTSFYIGLEWNEESQKWQWLDETPLGEYQPWEDGQPPQGTNTTCVTLTTTKKWMATDCRNGYYYTCQNPVCSCDYYCP